MIKCLALLATLLLLWFAPRTVTQARTQPPTPRAKPKYALLVGISKYNQAKGFEALAGPLNDVEDVKSSLVRNFGFRSEYIRILTDEAATRRGIVAAIRSALRDQARAHPDGTFLFYYSGHGSQTRDVNGDEKLADPTDTLDETLVPFDSTRDANDRQHFDLIDDDLERLFGEVRGVNGFSGSLTTILDCCYSGTATRGSTDVNAMSRFPRARQVVPDSRTYPAESLVRGLPGKSTRQGDFAAFSACLNTETSQEDTLPEMVNGQEVHRAHGVMTYYLLQAMQNATCTTTNNQIWSQIARGLAGQYQQNPQLEERGVHTFLGGATQDRVPTIPYVLTGRTLKFKRGIEAGAVPGGFVALYGSQAKAGSDTPFKQLQITRAHLGESEIALASVQGIPTKGAVRLLTPFFGSKPLVVGLGTNLRADNPVVKKLAVFCQGTNSAQMRFAKAGERPDVTLNLGAYPLSPSAASNGADTSVRGYFFSLGNGGAPLFDVVVEAHPNDGVEDVDSVKLQKTLENYAVQSRVLALSNDLSEGQKLGQAVKIRAYRVQGRTDRAGDWDSVGGARTPLLTSHRMKLKVNEGVQFEFENQVYKTLHIALLWLSQDGSVTALEFPNSTKTMVLKPKGSPGSKVSTSKYGVTLPDTQNLILPQSGTENIKVFVSTQPIDVYYLERKPVNRSNRKSNGALSPFDVIAGEAIGTRAAVKQSDPVDFRTWATVTLGLSIVR